MARCMERGQHPLKQKGPHKWEPLMLNSGGADGTRTRDPRRDRPVF